MNSSARRLRGTLAPALIVIALVATCAPSYNVMASADPHMVGVATSTQDDQFDPDHQSTSSGSVILRSEPSSSGGASTVVAELPPDTPLIYLGEEAPTDNPDVDGERWMKFALADGREGWLREIDVVNVNSAPAGPNEGSAATPDPPSDACAIGSERSTPEPLLERDDTKPFFPPSEALPCGFVTVGEGESTFEEVLASLGDSRDAEQRLESWGWKAHVYREYQTADGSLSMTISLHCFSDASSVDEAVPFFADTAAVSLQAEVVAPEELDGAIALVTSSANGDLAVIYLGSGSYLVRIAVASTAADPLPIALWIAHGLRGIGDDCGRSTNDTDSGAEGTGELVETIEDQVLMRQAPSTTADIEA